MSRQFKLYALFLPALAIMTLGSLGCEEGQMGGPGAEEGEEGTATEAEEAQMFTATVSEDAIELAQGEEAELTLSIDRGEEFTQIVQIEMQQPDGLTVDTDQTTLADGDTESEDDEATVTVMAPAGAETKEYALNISFTPPMGEPVVKVVQVTVTAAEPQEEALEDEASDQN